MTAAFLQQVGNEIAIFSDTCSCLDRQEVESSFPAAARQGGQASLLVAHAATQVSADTAKADPPATKGKQCLLFCSLLQEPDMDKWCTCTPA